MIEKPDTENFTENVVVSSTTPALFKRWLPPGIGRKLILLFFIGMGCLGISEGRYLWALYWLIAMTFSPRMVGYFVRAYSSLMKKINQSLN